MGPTACLLHTDCLFRAGIDAYAAIDAGLRVYLCFSVFHRDCLTGAFLDAGFATSAFFFVNLCRHFNTLSKKSCLKDVEDLLKKEWPIVERFVKELLEKEELEYDEIEAIFKECGKSHNFKKPA